MKKRTRIILIVLPMLLVTGIIVAWQWRPLLMAGWKGWISGYTTALPTCDRVEIHRLDGATQADAASGFPVMASGTFSGILGRATVSGKDAEALAELWRAQTFGYEYQALCHNPAYGLRFYSGSSLRFETSVCFECSNFVVTTFGQSSFWGFDAKSKKAAELQARLHGVFFGSMK